jgi:hypothetical protein
MIVRVFLTLLFALCAVLSACRKTEITAYRVPKEKDPEMPGITTGAAQGAALTWIAPAHWKTKPGSAMRKGSYAIVGEGGAEADMSITAFPNDVGGELANVNRWRGQIQLSPIGEGELANLIVRHEHNGLKFGEVDLHGDGANAQRILGAWVAFEGATWFFKLMGPDSLVTREKEAFAAFIDSVKPTAAPTSSAP